MAHKNIVLFVVNGVTVNIGAIDGLSICQQRVAISKNDFSKTPDFNLLISAVNKNILVCMKLDELQYDGVISHVESHEDGYLNIQLSISEGN